MNDGGTPKEIIVLVRSFIPEMLLYKEETDFNRFPTICTLFNDPDNGTYIYVDNWYDVPGILRMIAPLNSTLLKLDDKVQRFKMFQDILKNVPHTVLTMPWVKFDAKEYLQCRNAKDVSNGAKRTNCRLRFY